jgi:Fe2+ transport system protein FeoA
MDSPSKAPGPDPGTIERIALVGNPNVGKSVVFGWLTGQYVTVSNYPGTTVEVTQGNCKMGGRRRVIVDTPGINNLIPMSEDERVTRDILLEDGDIKSRKEKGRVVFITPKSRSRLERLSALGLIPGSVVRLAQKHPSFLLEVGETTLALDEEIVREVYAKKV